LDYGDRSCLGKRICGDLILIDGIVKTEDLVSPDPNGEMDWMERGR